MDDLIAFLLARISDDEAAVRALDDRMGRIGRRFESADVVGWEWLPTDDWDDAYRLATTASRVITECGAKRRIIRELTGTGANEAASGLATRILEALALPYADHPDHRLQWRL